MKHLFHLILIAGFLQSCVNNNLSTSQTADIKRVETSLVHRTYFEGDSLWSIEERMKYYGVPGVSIAVIKDNKIEWEKAYGVMDKESKLPVTTSTLFQAASISKPVSAYCILTLAEQKKLNLDENINSYLKSWQLQDNEFTKEKKVSLRELLSHSAGVNVHGFLGYSPGLPVPTLLEVLDGKKPANSEAIRVNKLPGESFRYSGGGFCIMQQMMIDQEGKPFPRIMQELVLHPLGMDNSTYDQPLQPEQLKMAATGYLPNGSMTKGKRHTYPELAPAGLWTTADNLAKFAINLQLGYKGESHIAQSHEIATKMLKPVVKDFVGLGIFISERKKDVYFAHDGWNEGFSSQMIAHRDKGYGVVVMINSNHPEFINELVRAVALTYKWDNYVPQYKKMKITPEQVKEIAGRYFQNNDEVIKVYGYNNHLFKKKLRGEPLEIFKISDSTYVSSDNQLIQFKTNSKNGKLDLLILHPFRYTIESTCPRMETGEKTAFELLEEGDFERSLKAYQDLLKANPNDIAFSENNLIQTGYDLLNAGKMQLAEDLMRMSTFLYPKNFNPYDSYAEACMKNGKDDLAVINYKKSLVLNPSNTNAEKMLEELQRKKTQH
jgi:CubicO group peptidase (beta-lactamase class C family)